MTFEEELQHVEQALSEGGVVFDDLNGLMTDKAQLRAAIPILAEFLPTLQTERCREIVVNALGASSRSPDEVLVGEFERTTRDRTTIGDGGGLAWAVASALSRTATAACYDRLVAFLVDPSLRLSRQMLVSAIGRVRSRRLDTIRILRALLDDSDVAAHCVEVLGRLKAVEAEEDLVRCLDSEAPLVRREAKMALRKMGLLESRPVVELPKASARDLMGQEAETSISFDLDWLPDLLVAIDECLGGSLGPGMRRAVLDRVSDLEVDREARFALPIVVEGESELLFVRVFMSDADAPDLYFHGSGTAISVVEKILDRWLQ